MTLFMDEDLAYVPTPDELDSPEYALARFVRNCVEQLYQARKSPSVMVRLQDPDGKNHVDPAIVTDAIELFSKRGWEVSLQDVSVWGYCGAALVFRRAQPSAPAAHAHDGHDHGETGCCGGTRRGSEGCCGRC